MPTDSTTKPPRFFARPATWTVAYRLGVLSLLALIAYSLREARNFSADVWQTVDVNVSGTVDAEVNQPVAVEVVDVENEPIDVRIVR
jgi:hypothetical protein